MLYNLEQGKNLSDFDFAQQCRIWTDLAKKANPNPNPNPNPSPNPSPSPNQRTFLTSSAVVVEKLRMRISPTLGLG